jgi:hypothetical protein
MRAPALLARAGMAGLAPSPPTSPLAPAAQVSRSPLWLKSRARYCGSILAPVALLWPASGSAQLPLVMGVQPGCVLVCRIAGPYRHCRPRWAQWGGLGPGLPYVDRRLHRLSGARRQSEPALSCARMAGTSQCGGPSAPRGCASLGVTGLCATNLSTIGMAPLRLLSRPSWHQARAGPIRPGQARSQLISALASAPCHATGAIGPPTTHPARARARPAGGAVGATAGTPPPLRARGRGTRSPEHGSPARDDHGQCTPRP